MLVIATGTSTRADESIKADTTLKSNNTVVTPSTADGKTTYTITGGAERNSGRYLFHSFAAFNLLKNEIGHFNNLDSVNTIFSRVTGLSQSNIDGLIRANGAANLYLINPKGIVFGPNARIDVGGAFKASTAEALLFKSEKFSAIDPQDAPVLTSDIVPGLQFGSTPATLNNAGVLVVKEGQEILLAGGPDDTVISSGTITANGGAITLEGGDITISGEGIQANNGGSINLSANTISFDQGAKATSVTSGSGNGGTINVDAGSLSLAAGSQLTTAATNTSTSKAGDINLNASKPRDLSISFSGNGSIINTKTESKAVGELGKGGDIKVGTTNQTLTINGDGSDPIATTRITTQTNGVGNGGQISLLGSNITITDKAKVATETIAAGNGGLLSVDAGALNLAAGSQLFSTTTGAGNGGSFSLNASTPRDLAIAFSGNSLISSTTEQLAAGGGQGGSILLGTTDKSLSIAGAGSISAASSGSGNAGAVELRGTSVSLDQGSKATSASSASGSGGSITVDAGSLNLSGGSQLTTAATATSTNKGGDINLNASTPRDLTISFSGDGSIINAKTESKAVGELGQGGDIKIGTTNQKLTIKGDGSDPTSTTRITTQTNGVGNGGQISLLGSNITITDKAKVTTETTAAGNGGSISLSTKSLQLGANTQITSSASGTGAGGAITVAPAAVAPLQIKGPGLIETQPASSGVAGAIRIGSTSAAPGSTTASDLSLSDGVRLQTSRSSVDLASTGTTSLQGGSISAAGSTVAIKGDTSVSIQGTAISALNPTTGQPPLGSIAIKGGAIKVGGETGRTLLRAGDAQNLSKEEENASNLTLLDSAVTLTAAAGKSIEVFSGTPTLPGTTTLRTGITNDDIPTNSNAIKLSVLDEDKFKSGLIVVGGIISDTPPTPTPTSSNTTITTGTSLTAKDIYSISSGALSDKSRKNGSINSIAAELTLGLADLLATEASSDNTFSFRTTGGEGIKGDIKLIFNPNETFAPGPNSSGDVAKMRFTALNNIEFHYVNVNIQNNNNKAGAFRLESTNGNIILENTKLNALGNNGSIVLSANASDISEKSINLLNSELNTSITDGVAAGSIELEANYVNINNSKIISLTTGSGSGGIVKVDADSLNLSGGSQLTTEATNSSNSKAGGINLNSSTPRDLTISFSGKDSEGNFSQINAQTASQGIGVDGKGGDIKIGTANQKLTIKGDKEDSTSTTRITAQTYGVGNGGSISLFGSDIKISDKVKVTAETMGSGIGGDITLKGSIINFDSSTFTVQTSGSGKGGNIFLDSSDSINLSSGAKINAQATKTTVDTILTDGSGKLYKIPANNGKTGDAGSISLSANAISLIGKSIITAETQTYGEGGLILLNSDKLNLFGGSQLTTEATNSSTSKAGNIYLNNDVNYARDLTISFSDDGSIINAKTASQGIGDDGKGGDIKIGAANQKLTIKGDIIDPTSTSRITAQTNGVGKGGSISLFGSNINITDKAKVTAKTTNAGIGGTVNVYADALNLSGGSQLTTEATKDSSSFTGSINLNASTPRDLSISFSGDGSIINAQTASKGIGDFGKGGDIKIGTATKALSINGPGSITAETKGSGNGGNINMEGTSINLDSSTFTVQTSGSGKGGNIFLDSSDSINLSSGAKIIAQTEITNENKGNTGDAGNINLSANNVTLKARSIINAETQTTGIGGLISVNSDKLNLSDGSQLTTAATITSTSMAGSINLNASTPRELTISFTGKDAEGNFSKINAQTASQGIGDDGKGGGTHSGVGTAPRKLHPC
jgi:filamentous hemagglutinin family protein